MSVDAVTGPLLSDTLRESNPHIAPPPPGSRSAPAAGAELFQRPKELLKHLGGQENSRRLALLGILLSELQEVPFDDVAVLLDVKAARLEAVMHGDVQPPPQREARWQLLAESLHNLHRILKPSATAQWLHTDVPDLDGKSPLEAIKRGKLDRVLGLTRSYLDPSFS